MLESDEQNQVDEVEEEDMSEEEEEDEKHTNVETVNGAEKVKAKRKKRLKFKPKKLVMNVMQTKYHVVRYVARKLFNMRLSTYSQNNHDCNDEKHEWDIMWTDNGSTVERLYKMKPY